MTVDAVKITRESPRISAARCGLVSIVIFLVAQGMLLVGITTPDKFVFDEVHYVPAARLDSRLRRQSTGWRYGGTLFGALAIVAIYLCALALFENEEIAIAASLIAFFNQMLFVMARTAMLDIFALTFGLFGIAAFLFGFRKQRPHIAFALAGLAFGLSTACKWSGLFPLATCIVAIAVIRLMQGWRTSFADGRESDWYRPDLWPGFKAHHFAIAFALLPAVAYFSSFIALYGLSLSDLIEAQRRIFADRPTNLYERVAVLAVAGTAGLVPI